MFHTGIDKLPPLFTDLYFHCCTGHSLAHLASATQSVPGLGCWRFTTPRKMQSVCANLSFLSWRSSRTLGKTQQIGCAQKIKPTIHRNSKWSCSSTCFGSSGRICAVCEPKPTTLTGALSLFHHYYYFCPGSHSQITVYEPCGHLFSKHEQWTFLISIYDSF